MLLLCLFAAACTNPRRDAEISTPPATPQEAALRLTDELSHHGLHIRGVSAGLLEVFWESDYSGEAAPPVERTWIGNTLTYEEIQRVSGVEHDAIGWLLEINARGGKVRLWLDNRDSGLRVRAALLKLTQP